MNILTSLLSFKRRLNPSINFLSALRRSVLPVSFALLNLIIVWIILTTSQAQDLIKQREITQTIHFSLVSYTFLWSLFIYFTAHFSLRYSQIYVSSTEKEIKEWCDKMIQKIPFSLVILQLLLLIYVFLSAETYGLLINIGVVAVIICSILFVIEKKIIPPVSPEKESLVAFFQINWKKVLFKREGSLTKIIIAVVIGIMLLFLVVCFLFLFFGQTFSSLFNPLSVIIIAASFWLFPTLFLSLSAGRYRIPSYTIVVFYVWLISGFNNNHQVRIIESNEFETRPTDVQYANNWIKRLIAEEKAAGKDTTEQIPIYLIAGEGGGIRAAYWTGNLLAKFDSLDKDFYHRTLALSGVSGSSIGMCFFQGLKHQGTNQMTRNMSQLSSKDYLTPLLVGFFFPDMMQRICPFIIPGSDRTRYLEDGFSSKFNDITNENTLNEAFLKVSSTADSASPILFFNTTEVETGRKALISNVKLTKAYFYDVVDVIKELKADMPMKTAATNSARFPIVTPPGLLNEDNCKSSSLVDGGYFENTGLHTTFQLLRILQDSLDYPLRERIQPRIIFIRNGDASLSQPTIGRKYEWSPLVAFINAWDRKSIPIEYDFNKITPEIFYPKPKGFKAIQETISLNRNGENKKIPLGWILSEASRSRLNAQMPEILAKYRKIFK